MNYQSLYVGFLKKRLKLKRPLKIVADASNGYAGVIMKALCKGEKNLRLISINDKLDGNFPAHGPNPLARGATDDLAKRVRIEKADFGVVFDADADRAIFVDEKGSIVPSHIIMLLISEHLKPPYIVDEPTYDTIHHLHLERNKLKEYFPSRVGQFYLQKVMKEKKATIGGEYSGHYCFREMWNTDSAILTVVYVLSALSQLPYPISQFSKNFTLQVSIMKNVPTRLAWGDVEKKLRIGFSEKGVDITTRDGVTFDFGDAWLNVRPSGTEPLVRITAGASTNKEANAYIVRAKKLF